MTHPQNAPELAARLIANGYRPIPIPHGQKGPRITGWQHRQFDAADFAPSDNIGLRCGDNGTAFLDVDIYDPATVEAIATEWTRRHRGPWMRRTGQAPKTGYVFRLPQPIKKTRVAIAPTGHAPDGQAAAVEVLCDGQQFVAFGVHPDTRRVYRWHGLDPLDDFLGVQEMLPEITEASLRDFLDWVTRTYGAEKPAQSLSERATAAISAPAGAAQPMRRTGDSASFWRAVNDAALADLDAWVPALLPQAKKQTTGAWRVTSGDLGRNLEEDLSIHPDGIQDFGPEKACTAIDTVAQHLPTDPKGAAMWLCERLSIDPQSAGWNEPAAQKPVAKGGFQFVPVADLKYRAPEYIVEELIETETLGLIFGDPGCGKSFLAVDIALSVATGTPFHGRPTRQGPVFFIAGEGHNGLARRFAAWSKARDIPLDGVPLFKSERAAQFLDGASAQAVSDAVAGLAAQHGPPALIILDTLARNFGGGNENDTKDMSQFVVAVDDLKARFPGCAVLIVHHSGHAEKQRARGAMALKGALDCEFRVEKHGLTMKLVNTKMKDAGQPQDIHFRFEPVDLDGDATSAVLEATEAPERTHRLTPTQRLALDTYEEAAAANPQSWQDGVFLGLHVDAWRGPFYARHTADTADGKRKAFQRARADLVTLGQMTVEDDVYTATDAGLRAAISLQRDMRDIAGQFENVPVQKPERAGHAGQMPKACPVSRPDWGYR